MALEFIEELLTSLLLLLSWDLLKKYLTEFNTNVLLYADFFSQLSSLLLFLLWNLLKNYLTQYKTKVSMYTYFFAIALFVEFIQELLSILPFFVVTKCKHADTGNFSRVNFDTCN